VLLAGLFDIAVLGATSELSLVVQDVTGSHALADLILWLFPVPIVAWLAPKISYRRRDALLGSWMILTIGWRIASLPYRDWPPRDDEVPQAQYIGKAELGAQWKPEYAGLWQLPGVRRVVRFRERRT
jgi:hypothetical protein